MLERAREVLGDEEAWVVGGAVRDELLGRPVVDVDIACRNPREAAERYGGPVFPLSDRHGAWRVALNDGRTVDFTPVRDGIHADLATRDFTINAIARPLAGGEPIDPFGGLADLDRRVLRAVGPAIFQDDPLRLLRAVRLPELEQVQPRLPGALVGPGGDDDDLAAGQRVVAAGLDAQRPDEGQAVGAW